MTWRDIERESDRMRVRVRVRETERVRDVEPLTHTHSTRVTCIQ